MKSTIEPTSIFVSYSWDSEQHKNWVGDLADRLEEIQELHIKLDQYDLTSYSDKNFFMEKGVFESDVILVVVTEDYLKKADGRSGGVGIETKMASALHWAESDKKGESRLIAILREGEEVPRYLKEKLYVDFRNPEKFEKSFSYLLKLLKGTSKRPRPSKTHAISDTPREKTLSRIEDFLKINHKKRYLIFNKEDSTDYSSGNKIKFELWKTESPSIDYFLFLFDNIIISSTIERLSQLLKREKITLPRLTVLRPEIRDKDYLDKIFKKNGLYCSLNELTYSDYVWNYCIDDEAKSKSEVFQTPFFIDQPLVGLDGQQENHLGPSFRYIAAALDKTQQSSAKIIIAPGGTGKTTLCHKIAKHCNEKSSQVPVLIQAEMLKSQDLSALINGVKIESVYDLYEIYAKVSGKENDDSAIFDRITFETAILAGKLVIIIDGIDEFISIFPETFDLFLFLESVEELNSELCSSRIVITTRSDVFDHELMHKFQHLDKYILIGFDAVACRSYLEQRFAGYSNPKEITDIALSNINPIIEKDDNRRILPFVVDLLATVAEEAVLGQQSGLTLSLDGVSYHCLGGTTDYLIASVLRRETVRQSIEASIDEIMEIFWELAVSFGDVFPLSELEGLINIMCPADAQKILRNPLLDTSDKDLCRFKYDFLSSYFKALYVINTISNGPVAQGALVKLVSRYPYGDGEVFKEVIQYARKKPQQMKAGIKKTIDLISKDIKVPAIVRRTSEDLRAISFLVRIISELNDSQSSKEKFTDNILEVFGANNGVLSNFSIFGDCIPLDFENLKVCNSLFVNYKTFTRSKFSNTTFINCYFDETYGEVVSDSFTPTMFQNCRLGDLDGAIAEKTGSVALNKALVEKELRKYFTAFYNGGRFVDKKKEYFKYSERVRGIDNKLDDSLLKMGVLEIRIQKSDHSYYKISEAYQSSVYSFITNNRVDSKIASIIKII